MSGNSQGYSTKNTKREQELLTQIKYLETRIKTLEDDKKQIRKDKDIFANLALDNAKNTELCMNLVNELIRKIY